MLKVAGISVSYGQTQALLDVSIDVAECEVVSIIGANGAGKSTLMKSIMGRVKSQNGNITYLGESLNRVPIHKIVAKGIVCVPEGREIFNGLTVQDNLEMGAISRKYSKKELQEHYDEVYSMFPILSERRRQLAGSLSGGQQQMLALGRGMMSSPKLMMFDEPSLGLAPIIVDEVFDFIERINKEKGITIILVEQNAYMALKASSRCYVLENGVVSMSGASSDLMEDSRVRSAYLGA